MSQPPILIFAGDSRWKLARGDSLLQVQTPSGANAQQLAADIATMLGSSAASATLAIPASWCMSATVSLKGIPTRHRRASLLYRLELLLPLTAEDIAADYILDEPETALAICVSTANVKVFVDALETAGIAIQSIIPASIYAVQTLLAAQSPRVCDAVIWQANDALEIFTLRSGKIAGWYALPAKIDDLRWHLEQLFPEAATKLSLLVCGVSSDLLGVLNSRPSLQVIEGDTRTIEDAAASANRAGVTPQVELRRDGLAPGDPFRAVRRPLTEAIIAAVVLVVCICGAACCRAIRLERLADTYRIEQETLFYKTFPGHALPVSVVGRLRSEQRSLVANRDTDAGDLTPKSALPMLNSVLVAIDGLPKEVRLAVEDLKVDDQRFSLEGVVRNRGDLAGLVDSLGHISQLRVDPPETEQLAGQGLHITVTGTRVQKSAAK